MDKPNRHSMISEKVKKVYYLILGPVIQFFIHINANPNIFTMAGLLFGGITAVFFGLGYFRTAGLFLLLAGMCDSIDGTIARRSGRASKFGALLDSTLDRYTEMLIFFGMAYYFSHPNHRNISTLFALALGLGGSLMVSYVRARAEGLGFECKVGMMQRVERMLLLTIGALTFKGVLIVTIWIVAIFSNITAIHRLFYIRKKDRELVKEMVLESTVE
jgi:CDP-diacylglycerol--glycerol-3-phosphate 3-phosphatidyltransferase